MPRERKSELFNHISIANGRHLAAARTKAGLKQTELAQLAGIHPNTLKRLERMDIIPGGWAIGKIEAALKSEGVICQLRPLPSIWNLNGA